jgi:glycosyltransferase involved in cell wall biosynthesis
MHILITVNSVWNAFNFRASLIQRLLSIGHRVTILAPPEPEAEKLKAMGCSFVPLKMDRTGISPVNDIALLWRLLRHFRHEAPDIVLGFTIKNNIYGAIAARILGIGFLPNITGLGTAFMRRSALTYLAIILYRVAFYKVPQVLFQNRDDLELFISRGLVCREQAVLLPGSGVDLTRFQPAPLPSSITPEAGPVFLLVGRILRDKGVREFVEAARLLKARYPNARCQMLGATDAANRTAIRRSTIDAWVAEGTVEFLGYHTDVRPAMTGADCIVLPSYREGTPRTLLEGAAMARPLIATNVPGCRDVVDDGVTGLICTVMDGADLGDKMIRFVALSATERREMGLAGRRKVERDYDEAIVIERYLTAIATTVASAAT